MADSLPPINSKQAIVDPDTGRGKPAFVLLINQLIGKVLSTAGASAAAVKAELEAFLATAPTADAPLSVTGTYGSGLEFSTGDTGVSVSDGITTVDPATKIVFTGATVTDAGGGEADVSITGGGGGGGGPSQYTATIDSTSGSTTRFNAGMSTYELDLSAAVTLAKGSYVDVELIINRATSLDRGIIISPDGVNGYGMKFQADGNKVFYRYDGSEHLVNALAFGTADTSTGECIIELKMLVDDITINGNKYDGAANHSDTISMNGNGGGARDNNLSMIGGLRLFAITDVAADFVSCRLKSPVPASGGGGGGGGVLGYAYSDVDVAQPSNTGSALPITGMSINFTAKAGFIKVSWSVLATVAAGQKRLAVDLDGAALGNAGNTNFYTLPQNENNWQASTAFIIEPITAGAHTLELLYNDALTASAVTWTYLAFTVEQL